MASAVLPPDLCLARAELPEASALSSLRAQGLPEGFNVQLLPWGAFSAVDGRPGEGRCWRLDDAAARSIVDAFAALKNDVVVDYEHQSLLSALNGQRAPAAGWITALHAVSGVGLFARVEWTAEAARAIAAREYRYISPVFAAEQETLRVTRFLNAALTNTPGLDGMAEASLAALSALAGPPVHQPAGANGDMDLLTSLRVALGLGADATAESALAAVAALKTDLAKLQELEVALKAAAFDPLKHVPIEAHKAVTDELAALKAAQHKAAVSAEVEAALAARKLAPAQKAWALSLGEKDIEALRAFVKDAPEVAPAGRQSDGRPTGGGVDAPEAVALAARKWMNEQAALGRVVSSVEAVAHVMKKG